MAGGTLSGMKPMLMDRVERRILLIRGRRVMLDADLAELYGVPTKVLNQAVKRNPNRFPLDFVFRLTPKEKREVVTNCDHLRKLRFSSTQPYVFTEHGAIMLASVLSSSRAVEMSVYVVRAFVRLREILTRHRGVMQKLTDLETRIGTHDEQIRTLFDAIRELMAPSPRPRRRIGFHG